MQYYLDAQTPWLRAEVTIQLDRGSSTLALLVKERCLQEKKNTDSIH